MLLTITDDMKNNFNYNGTTPKFGVTINNKNYIVKSNKHNDLSVLCEYIASNFILNLGISCQQVYLGYYNNNLVDIIYDFASNNNCYLHVFKDTKQSSADTDIGDKEYTYDDVLYLINKHLKLAKTEKLKMTYQFWQMYICDAILANRDRNPENWGYLGKNDKITYIPAPIYDNGASLFPGINSAIVNINQNRKQFFYDRVYTFPASVFKIQKSDRTYKTNYNDVFSDLRVNKIFAEEVKLFRQRFSYKEIYLLIYEIIFSIPIPIDINICKFWIEIVTLRYMCIVLRMDFNKSFNIIERWVNQI